LVGAGVALVVLVVLEPAVRAGRDAGVRSGVEVVDAARLALPVVCTGGASVAAVFAGLVWN